MLEIKNQHLQNLLEHLANNFAAEKAISPEFYDELQQHPEYGIEVMQLLPQLDDNKQTGDTPKDEAQPLLLACLHYIEMCLIQLKLAQEHYQRWADELVAIYQAELLTLLEENPDSNCWLPVINLFFDAEIAIDDSIKQMYLSVMEKSQKSEDQIEYQQLLVKQLLADDSDALDYEVAELFLAQTNALPTDYFPSFIKELLAFNLTKAVNAAILFLLHPMAEVRDIIISNANEIFADVLLPPESMSRLLMIRHWLPEVEKFSLEILLNNQRKKGAVFAQLHQAEIIEVKATDMDGTGAQAIFLLLKRKNGYQAGGLLVKRYYGIKDTWLSPILSKQKALQYAKQNLQGDFFLRKVDKNYLDLLVADHIYQSQKIDAVPHINLLQLQELTSSQWQAQPLNIELIIANLISKVDDFANKQWQEQSLLRSGNWYRKYEFTESWFDESPELDKLVNQSCSFLDGIKQCNMSLAMPSILEAYFEPRREQWLEHFLWLTLWAKPNARHNEYLWKDSLTVANALYNNKPMLEIPIIQVICEHSILQSIETMENRKTHLS